MSQQTGGGEAPADSGEDEVVAIDDSSGGESDLSGAESVIAASPTSGGSPVLGLRSAAGALPGLAAAAPAAAAHRPASQRRADSVENMDVNAERDAVGAGGHVERNGVELAEGSGGVERMDDDAGPDDDGVEVGAADAVVEDIPDRRLDGDAADRGITTTDGTSEGPQAGASPPPDPAADGDVQVIESGPSVTAAGRRSIGASTVWRDTDFRESSGAGPPPPAAAPLSNGHVTPEKTQAGGFLAGKEITSPQSEDGQCCSICFEPWSNSGDHRIASLRCGHLFGKSCIDRWLKGRDQRCPQCNAKANRRDIRVIFAKSLRVLDTTDRDRALEELEREREAKRKLELDFAVVQVKCQMKENTIEKLQAELRALRDRVGEAGGGGGGGEVPPATPAAAASLSLQTTLELSRAGGCRVMEHNGWLGMLVVSQPSSQSALFPGHGVRKINTLDMRALQFVSLHQKQVRDVRFSPDQRDLLLSVSLDRRAKITNLCGNTLVQTYELAAPCWSGAWDAERPHQLYVGLQSGAVVAFDTRAGAEPVFTLDGPAGSPVVALKHVPEAGAEAPGGLLACRLAACSLHELTGERRRHELPLDGPFVSADYDARSRHLLVSSRPSSRQPHARHTVCRLRRLRRDAEPPLVSAEVVQVFRGGTSQRVLSRTALLPHPARPAPLVCASQETARVTQFWDLASGECAVTLAASEPVLDACPLSAQDREYVALLTERAVRMYRWEVT